MIKNSSCAICKKMFVARKDAKKYSPLQNTVMDTYKVCFSCLAKHPGLITEYELIEKLQFQVADLGHDRMFRLIDKITRGFTI